ncbi:MAG: hypothetical protein JWN27_2936 [Candidatus Eremiobacteraeota bacterium]|nr:hypothetical protein [Candidatus Eremiobacteraeota bacterium]
MQRPFLQFYPRDWRGDTRLRSTSFAARGLWIEMMALMHDADPYGYLIVASKRLSEADFEVIAEHVGGSRRLAEVKRLLAELKDKEVYSVADDGTIYSRRMVRDEERRLRNVRNGQKSSGNPALRSSVNPPADESDYPSDNRGSDYGSDIAHARTRSHVPRARDRDPDTRDQSTETAPPSGASARTHEDPLDDDELPSIPAGEIRTGRAMQFATWFVRAALKAGALPKHLELKAADIAYREFPHAEPLVASWPPAELEARSRRLFAKKLDATNPLRKACSIATLSQHWDWFGDDLPPARTTGGPVRPSGGGMPDINLETLG